MSVATPLHSIAVIGAGADENHRIMASLGAFFRVSAYADAAAASYAFHAHRPDLVFVDEGAAACDRQNPIKMIRLDPRLAGLPIVLMVSANGWHTREEARKRGADASIEKPLRRETLLGTASRMVSMAVEAAWEQLPETPRAALKDTARMFGRLSSMLQTGEPVEYESVKDACLALVDATRSGKIQTLLDGVRGHDDYTYAHSLKVAALLSLFGSTVGLSDGHVMLLASGGLLHDVGKMAIPHEVLNKPAQLNPQEWEVMRSHVIASVEYLRGSPVMPEPVIVIAEQHHEKLDGSGYPRGLAGGQLNELARMSSIVDIFSAVTDRRVYKPGMSAEKALAWMAKQMRGGLDPTLFEIFRSMVLDQALKC